MNRQSWSTGALAAILVAPAVVRSQDATGDRELRRTPAVKAYDRVRDSVVNLVATERVEVRRWGRNIFGDALPLPAEKSVGSGFIIHEDGYIVTNAHVVSASAELKVSFNDGTIHDALIIGRDTARDLAVIKIESNEPLQPIPLGRSDDLMIGEQTIAVGNPVGLNNTVTTGVISALHRELAVQGRVICRDVIQTDAVINPGNSGGPLLNILGELIGINTAIRADAQSIGFAIPVDQLRDLLPRILDGEKLNRVLVGMRVVASEPPRVVQVSNDSPAYRAGVREGDIIRAIDGRAVSRGVDYHVAMLNRKPNDVVRLDFLRDGRPRSTELTIAPRRRTHHSKALALTRLGIVVADVKEKVAQRFRWDNEQGKAGVIIVAVDADGPARNIDLQPGDLLVSMGSFWLTNVEHVGTLLADVAPSDPVDIGFRRERRGRLYDGEARLHAR